MRINAEDNLHSVWLVRWDCSLQTALPMTKMLEVIAPQEENLRAALLLEQAALCLLRVSPPSVRKYAFHMVLAGLRYNACDQKALGMRAYRFVISVDPHAWQ